MKWSARRARCTGAFLVLHVGVGTAERLWGGFELAAVARRARVFSPSGTHDPVLRFHRRTGSCVPEGAWPLCASGVGMDAKKETTGACWKRPGCCIVATLGSSYAGTRSLSLVLVFVMLAAGGEGKFENLLRRVGFVNCPSGKAFFNASLLFE